MKSLSYDFFVMSPRCYKDVYVNSFLLCTARLWNSLPIECFKIKKILRTLFLAVVIASLPLLF